MAPEDMEVGGVGDVGAGTAGRGGAGCPLVVEAGMEMWREEQLGGGEWTVSMEMVSLGGDTDVEEGVAGNETGASRGKMVR